MRVGCVLSVARGQLNALIGEWGFEVGAEDEDEPERLQEVVAALQKLQ